MNGFVSVTAKGGTNTGKYYTSGENWRIYQNENPKITFTSTQGATIVSIKISYTNSNTGTLTLNNNEVETNTVVPVNGNSITFSVGNTGTATNGQVRITAIEVIYKECDHQGTETDRVDASCEINGYITYTCSECGTEYRETISATGHNYDDGVVTAPTCTEDGFTTYTCKVCGDSYVADYVDKTGHTDGETVVENKVDATCTADGSYDNVVYCSVCGVETSRETVTVEATGHTYGEGVITPPTCVDEGYTTYTCSNNCGYSYTADTVEATGEHTFADGECTVCGALDHVHSYNKVVTDPTCTEQGYTTYTCSDSECGDTYVDDYTDALGHTDSEAVVENNVAADCENNGSYDNVVYCSVCGVETSRETVTVDATGHTDGETVVENEVDATCAANGSYDNVVYCSVCGDETSRETITVDATGHTFNCGECACGQKLSEEITTSMNIYANKGTTGTNTISWTSNGITFTNTKGSTAIRTSDSDHYRVYANSSVTITGQNITKIVITCQSGYVPSLTNIENATVTTNGTVVTITLTNAADSITFTASAQWRLNKVEVTSQTKYSMSDKDTETHEYTSIVVTEPTCGKIGYTTYTCKCGSHTDNEVAALEHNYEAVVIAPTCVADGYTTHTCANCGDSYTTDTTEATGEHNFVDGKCTVCEQEEGHTHSYTSEVTAPTCVDKGYTTYTCECGDTYTADEVEATGEHTYVDGTCSCGATENVGGNTPTEPITYTFANYAAGTQYAENEVHKLDDNVTVTTTQAHFTTQLRLYSSTTNNAYAVFQSAAPITGISFNAGNKTDTLNVYGSTDGETWTLIQGVNITSTSYKDYTVSGDYSYTYIKLDVAGTQQVRLQSITFTW